MGRDFTDDIDDCCEAIVGHTNWGFVDTELNKDPKVKCVVVFYKEPDEDEDEEEEEENG
tara:strand:+ start:214 stop:390 length:177 start_codon:yes stop_codon:yes gene_type:complete